MYVTAVLGTAAGLDYIDTIANTSRAATASMIRERRTLFIQRQYQNKFLVGHLSNYKVTEMLWGAFWELRTKTAGCRIMNLPPELCRARKVDSERIPVGPVRNKHKL